VPGVHKQHETILELDRIAVLVTDVGLHILSANSAASDVLGYSPAELSLIPVENLFSPEGRRRITATLSELTPLEHALVSLEEDCVRRNGEIFRSKINAAAVLNSDGSCGRVIMIEHVPEVLRLRD
jgi:PAS domain S-box-containing protein